MRAACFGDLNWEVMDTIYDKACISWQIFADALTLRFRKAKDARISGTSTSTHSTLTTMPPKRKRGRASTTRSQAAPVVEERPETPPPPPPEEEEVPTSFGLRDPLPVLKKRQAIETVPDREFKTLVER